MSGSSGEETEPVNNNSGMTSTPAALPFFPPFIPDSDPASTGPRWTKWVKRFENFLTAMNVTEPKRKRALLLHYIGEVAYDIFDTMSETGEDYDTAKEKLSGYFRPKKNINYEVYVFRQEKQRTGETLDQYTTRLRKLASTCEFTDPNADIKSQIILGCSSSRLRRRALRESTLTLDQLLSHGRAMETAEKQATHIEQTNEESHEINRAQQQQSQQRPAQPNPRETNRSRKCFNCGNNYPHLDGICPAKGKACRLCQKMNHFARCCRSTHRNVKPDTGVNNVEARTTAPQRQDPTSASTINQGNPNPADSSSDDEYILSLGNSKTHATKSKVKSPKVHVKVRNMPTEMMIDTGASVDIIDEHAFARLQKYSRKTNRAPITLCKMNTKVYGYGADKPLPLVGKFDVEIESSTHIVVTTIYVMRGTGGLLLSYETALALNLVKLTINATGNQQPEVPEENKLEQLLSKYDDRYHGVGKLKDCQVHLHINETVPPSAQPHRRIPFHLRKGLEQELTRLENEGIIEKVHGPTPWVSPLVVVPKPKNPDKVRLCVDMRVANKAIQRERHITPTIDDLINDLNGATVFSKLDLNQGYHPARTCTRVKVYHNIFYTQRSATIHKITIWRYFCSGSFSSNHTANPRRHTRYTKHQ